MASTEDRIRQLIRDNLDITDHLDFDASFGDHDISSVDAVAFAKLVGKTFGRQIPPADFAQFQNLRDLADYLDSNAG
ncbi:MAG: acyl carrier protein [Bryobacterales bacterium]|nr:acyl carrier protein [Bryobacterales bacterium]